MTTQRSPQPASVSLQLVELDRQLLASARQAQKKVDRSEVEDVIAEHLRVTRLQLTDDVKER